MANEAKKQLRGIRTFAADLEAERKKRGLDSSASPTTSKVKKDTGEHRAKAPIPKPVVTERSSEPIPKPPKKEEERPKEKETKIPAFHEIQKQSKPLRTNIEARPEEKKKKKKKDKKSEQTSRPNIGYDTTVITDTRSNRFKLLPSLFGSIGRWFKNIAAKRKFKKSPKYVVPETQRRKGVIQKATSKTGTMFSADNDSLKEQIRRRKLRGEEEDESETTWSPFTNVGYRLLEGPDEETSDVIQNVKVEYKKTGNRPIVITEPSRPQPTPIPEPEKVTPVPAPAPEVETEPIPEPEKPEVIPEPAEVPDSAPEPQLTQEESEQDYPESKNEVPETQPSPKANRDGEEGPFLERYDTNTLTLIILGSVVVLSLTILVAVRVTTSLLNSPTETPDSLSAPSNPIVEGATLINVTVGADEVEMAPQIINAAIDSGPAGLIELALVSQLGDELSPTYTFNLLRFQTIPTFQQSLTSIRFISLNHSRPALLLRFTDKDIVRGGMLDWEENIYQNMSYLYGVEAVSATLVLTDETIAGIDVRVFRKEGETVLIYGLINENTALIASSITDFNQILEFGFKNQ